MPADWNVVLLIAFPIWIMLNAWLERRPRLLACLGRTAVFPGGSQEAPEVLTHSLLVANTGRGEAFNVRLNHRILPRFNLLDPKKFSVSPEFPYQVEDAAAGGTDIVLPVLAAHQQIVITYLYEPPLAAAQIHGEITSKAGPARLVEALPLADYPWWLALLGVQLLELLAVVGVVYYLLQAAKAIWT